MRSPNRALTVLLPLFFAVGPLVAQSEAPVRLSEEARARAMAQIHALSLEKQTRSAALQKVNSQLIYAERMVRGVEVAPGIAAMPGALNVLTMDAQRRAKIEIKTAAGAANSTLVAQLTARGAEVVAAYPKYDSITAWVALSKLESLAQLPDVNFVTPVHLPMINRSQRAQITQEMVRSAQVNLISTTEGDHAHAADAMRSSTLAFGAGIKIGVISNGVASLIAEETAGALPAGVTVLPGQAGSGDEGTAMLEIVHTVAPSAQLYFATSGDTDAAMASNIESLEIAGCTVIIDDVTFFDEGAFQDGPIEKAVSIVASEGVLYFSSAANSGNLTDGTSGTWEGDYVAGSALIAGVGVEHSFGVDGLGQPEVFNPLSNASGFVSLKWSDPLGASSNDYDLYVFDGGGVLASSTDAQTGHSDPFEFVQYTPDAGEFVVVVNSGPTENGDATKRALRVDTNRGLLQIQTSGAAFGHNAGSDAISVAAVDVSTAGGGLFTGGAANPIETYSSDGLRRLFYSPTGTELTTGNVLFGTNGGAVLHKPDLAAADCVSVNIGQNPSSEFFPVFCGTSAAAPHAGAMAALGLSMSINAIKPTAAQVAAEFHGLANLDIMASGPDRDSGWGIVMANHMAHDLQVSVPPHSYYTVTPSRILDTRNPVGPLGLGGPALGAHGTRGFDLLGAACGVDAAATSLAVNVTVTQPGALGDLRIYPADALSTPVTTTINFLGNQTVANNAVLVLPLTASGVVNVLNEAAATVHLIIDVVGYFK
jgi:hypothetical protein